MSRKYYNFRTIDAGPEARIELSTQDTNYGFRHLAEYSGPEGRANAKCLYYNRTWETYEYQSVIHAVIDAAGVEDPEALKKVIDEAQLKKVNDSFGMLSAIMGVADVLSDKPEETADFKLRMLKAQFGDALIVPEDWDQLTPEVKNDRLDKISAMLKEV